MQWTREVAFKAKLDHLRRQSLHQRWSSWQTSRYKEPKAIFTIFYESWMYANGHQSQ